MSSLITKCLLLSLKLTVCFQKLGLELSRVEWPPHRVLVLLILGFGARAR